MASSDRNDDTVLLHQGYFPTPGDPKLPRRAERSSPSGVGSLGSPGLDVSCTMPQSASIVTDSSMESELHRAHRLTLHAREALRTTKDAAILIACNSTEMLVTSPYLCRYGSRDRCCDRCSCADVCRSGSQDGIQADSVSPGPVTHGRSLLMIEKWSTAHKFGVDAEKQKLLREAGISRHGGPRGVVELIAFLVHPAVRMDDRYNTSHRPR